MFWFVAGALFGGFVSTVTMCLCVAAGESDKHMGLK